MQKGRGVQPPSTLIDGMILVSGEVARTTDFERGFPIHWAKRDGVWVPDPLIMDDQCAIVNVRSKGLVVVTGCGHAGIINISFPNGGVRGLGFSRAALMARSRRVAREATGVVEPRPSRTSHPSAFMLVSRFSSQYVIPSQLATLWTGSSKDHPQVPRRPDTRRIGLIWGLSPGGVHLGNRFFDAA